MDYLKIKYGNTCDLGGTIFTVPNNPFFYVIYLDVDLGVNSYEILQEGREDGAKNFIQDLTKVWKKYTFTTVMSEFIYDAVSNIPLYDTIFVTTKLDETNRAYNFKVNLNDWVTENVCSVTVEFTIDYSIKYGCCSNERLVYTPCRTCSTFTVSGFIQYTDAIYTDPIGEDIVNGTYWLIMDKFGKVSLYQYTVTTRKSNVVTPVWTLVTLKDNSTLLCFTYLTVNWKFYFDGYYWYHYSDFNSLTDTGTQILVRGASLPNTWVQLYKSTDGITYTAVSGVTRSDVFAVSGIAATGLTSGLTYYFKFLMYDNNCSYGYSSITTVVKL